MNYTEKQSTLNKEIRSAKFEYKRKIENLFEKGNLKDAWRGLKVLIGSDKKQSEPQLLSSPGSADRLNRFYGRFDVHDFSPEIDNLKNSLKSKVSDYHDAVFGIPEDHIHKALNKIKIKKASGPDKISGKLLKSCKSSLFQIIYSMFDLSFQSCTFPSIWKLGEISPIAKKDFVKTDNDLRPITLTSILSKCLERVAIMLLMPHVTEVFDPLQFAYINGRSTEDAICNLIHRATKHLDANSTNTVRATFIDYISAFNTIQPHILLHKLSNLNVPAPLQLWLLDYLTDRPQYVRTTCEISPLITLNCGAPQGCVLSPILFILYTNDLCWNSQNVIIEKYADDTVILGLIKKDDDDEYRKCVNFVNSWCQENYLTLNASKTKEMVWDFRKAASPSKPVTVSDVEVERVSSYKYLGLILDNQWSFKIHAAAQIKKANKRVYCIRVMKQFRVNVNIMQNFFNSCVPPVLMYAGTGFYGSLTKILKYELDKPRRTCERLLGQCQLTTNDALYKTGTLRLAKAIVKDELHPLHQEYRMMPSGRRYQVCRVRTNRFRDTFIPNSIRLLNKFDFI